MDPRKRALLKQYELFPDTETAKKLLQSLQNLKRSHWVEIVENLNFNHSSKKSLVIAKKVRSSHFLPTSKCNSDQHRSDSKAH